MQIILKESRTMGHMVSQLLMLTRSDEGRAKLEIERIDLIGYRFVLNGTAALRN